MNPSNMIVKQTLDGSFGGILDLSWGIVDVRDVAKYEYNICILF